MAFNENDFIFEDVLFPNETPATESDVETEVLFTSANESGVEELSVDDTGIETLLTPNEEILEEVLFAESESGIEELAPIIENEEILEEVLFAESESGIEEIKVEPSDDFYISEESLTFEEPIKPSSINEETLFNNSEPVEEISEIDFNPSIASDELSILQQAQEVIKPKKEYIEKNFAQKLLEADKQILERYDQLKNIILLYKGVKSRISNDFDSFNKGRMQLFKLGFSTKSLKLYLNLDINEVEPRLKCRDVSNKKAYAQVPVFLRIKSERAMKNAKYLIDKVVEKYDLKENPRSIYIDSVEVLKQKAKTYNN